MRTSRRTAVANAITYVDNSIGHIVAALKQANLYASTAVIVTAKHGQSPTDRTKLVKNGDTLTKLLEANNYIDPNGNFGQNNTKTGNLNDGSGLDTGFVQTDDVGLIWLRDRNQRTAVVQTLKANLSCNAPGICADGSQAYILYGAALAERFGDPANGRTPDIIVQPNPGVIYVEHEEGRGARRQRAGRQPPRPARVVPGPASRTHGDRHGRHETGRADDPGAARREPAPAACGGGREYRRAAGAGHRSALTTVSGHRCPAVSGTADARSSASRRMTRAGLRRRAFVQHPCPEVPQRFARLEALRRVAQCPARRPRRARRTVRRACRPRDCPRSENAARARPSPPARPGSAPNTVRSAARRARSSAWRDGVQPTRTTRFPPARARGAAP